MPQLDSVTFLSQVFWLTVVFFTFYMIMVKNIIPSLSRMLKVRNKKLALGQESITQLQSETTSVAETYEQMVQTSLQESTELVNKTVNSANKWVEDSVKETNTAGKSDQAHNIAYLETVGKITGQKLLILSKMLFH